MGIFSIFSRGDTLADGSYCERSTETHKDYLEDEDIDDEHYSSSERKDEIIILDEFNDKAVNYRWDEYGNPVEHGPKQKP
jgi:hypothetical protein